MSLAVSHLLTEMFQDANFFLCLLVKSFFVPNNLQSDIGTQFVVEHFHDLVHNKAVLFTVMQWCKMLHRFYR